MDQLLQFLVVPLLAGVLAASVATVVLILRRTRSSRSVDIDTGPGDARLFIVLAGDSVLDLYKSTLGDARHTSEFNRSRGTAVSMRPGGWFGLGADRSTTWQEKTVVTPTDDPVLAISSVERHLQAENEIQNFDFTAKSDEGPLTSLLNDLQSSARKIGFRLPTGVVEDLRRAWKEQNRPVSDDALQATGEYVRVRAEFTVQPHGDSGDRLLTVTWGDPSTPVHVEIVCQRAHIRLPEHFPEHGTVTATCFGNPSWNAATRTLELTPFSIHRSRGRA